MIFEKHEGVLSTRVRHRFKGFDALDYWRGKTKMLQTIWEHPKCVNLFFCSDGSLARFLDIREQDAPTTNFIFAKLGCSQQFSCGAGILPAN